ncbi:MAG: DEAD/DEAH box helicase [Chloroflexi bacterium]|nr:DEAD/DEAH box helicase [Chloroflexota bacterium]
MSRSVRLRPWQHAALARYQASTEPDFLAVATPGAGKTTFALAALRISLAERAACVVIVAPTAHLKVQWAAAADRLGLHLDPGWSPGDGGLPADMHGVVTSYQQVAASAPLLRPLVQGSYVVLDEVHHAADDQAWGDSLREAFTPAARRLSLSGTPFRSDTRSIPFVRYIADEAVPDYEYGYGDALRDGRVVRPVYFPRTGGTMEWTAPDGETYQATFEDPLATALANQRLRTALSVDGEWLASVLGEAVERLDSVRRTQPDAGGLVIATDQDHARGIAAILERRFRRSATVVTSDDPAASERIARFAASSDPWLVAVRMVSEGVDIPRLRVGVYATVTTTDLFFRQAVGRFVRWVPGIRDQRAWLYLPDDPRLRIRAADIAESRRHSLRKDPRWDDRDGERPPTPPEYQGPLEQLSLFEALSATPDGGSAGWQPWLEQLPADWDDDADHAIEIELAPPPALRGSGTPDAADGAIDGRPRHRTREALRKANADGVRDIARVTGLSHATINGRLNASVGIRRIDLATVEQLEARLVAADRWYGRAARGS